MPPVTERASARKELRQFMMEEFKPERFQQIDNAWDSKPEVRSEVLQKFNELASDPNYPSHVQLTQLAKMIVGYNETEPPTTQPPMIEPPATQPPASEPPMSEPPTVQASSAGTPEVGPPVSTEDLM
jgi:hypothetical protein